MYAYVKVLAITVVKVGWRISHQRSRMGVGGVAPQSLPRFRALIEPLERRAMLGTI
jgi:hypothetical protein